MQNQNIDSGTVFDWGRTSDDYAKFRDIYPLAFYEKILERNCGTAGQQVLDIGTGTGVLPRNLYAAGAHWTGSDIAPNQIAQAKACSAGMDIAYMVSAAEDLDLPAGSFDCITACQCYWYFDNARIAPVLSRLLKPHGKVLFLCMEWLPYEDKIAAASENLVLQYNPKWSGAGETMHPIAVAPELLEYFDLTYHEEYLLDVPFTRDSWNGRMKACRGIGATLSPEEIAAWEKEHLQLLRTIAPEAFTVKNTRHAPDTSQKHFICRKRHEPLSWLHPRLHLLRQPFFLLSDVTRLRGYCCKGKCAHAPGRGSAKKAPALYDRHWLYVRPLSASGRTAAADTALSGDHRKIRLWTEYSDKV